MVSALGDDAQAVVFKGSEAVGSALDEFHFSVEALGDGVVAGVAPHAGYLLGPFGEGFSERTSSLEAAGTQGVDKTEQFPDMITALIRRLVLQAQQREEPFL